MIISKPTLSKLIAIITVMGFAHMGCNQPVHPKDQIKWIEIATSDGPQESPAIAIRIDSTLALKYYGGYKAKLQGYYSGVVTQGFWDTLNIKLKQINFSQLDTARYYGIDGQDAEVVFYWNKEKRHITRSIYEDPDSVSHVLIWIADIYKHIQLHKLKNNVKFETTYQFMMPPLAPKPKLDDVKFPPPTK